MNEFEKMLREIMDDVYGADNVQKALNAMNDMEKLAGTLFSVGVEAGRRIEKNKIIKCKDCKHRVGLYCNKENLRTFFPEDGFCSYAEKKGEPCD